MGEEVGGRGPTSGRPHPAAALVIYDSDRHSIYRFTNESFRCDGYERYSHKPLWLSLIHI
eukprot:4878065-Alexandrium_andersonii.AAC.1